MPEQFLEYTAKTSFTVISKGRVISIDFVGITHVSKYGNETIVYTKENAYRTYNSLQEILNDLPVNEFFRVHRSHIVSLKFINLIRKKRIRVGEIYLPISKYYKHQLCKQLAQLLDRNCFFMEKL